MRRNITLGFYQLMITGLAHIPLVLSMYMDTVNVTLDTKLLVKVGH